MSLIRYFRNSTPLSYSVTRNLKIHKSKIRTFKNSIKKQGIPPNVIKYTRFIQEIYHLVLISQFMATYHIQDEPIKKIYRKFSERNKRVSISKSTFYRLFRILGFRYKKIMQELPSRDRVLIHRILYMEELICDLQDKKTKVLFFDSTTFSDSNLKKRGWSLPNSNFHMTKKFSYSQTHLLLLIDDSQIVSVQLFKGNMINLDIISFLEISLDSYTRYRKNKKIVVVLDNATMHQTSHFKNFVLQNKYHLLFTVPRHPLFNAAEYVFRFIKTRLKNKYSLS